MFQKANHPFDTTHLNLRTLRGTTTAPSTIDKSHSIASMDIDAHPPAGDNGDMLQSQSMQQNPPSNSPNAHAAPLSGGGSSAAAAAAAAEAANQMSFRRYETAFACAY